MKKKENHIKENKLSERLINFQNTNKKENKEIKDLLIDSESKNINKQLIDKFKRKNNQENNNNKIFCPYIRKNTNNNCKKDLIEFSTIKDPRTGKEILIDKNTGENIFELKYDINNDNKPFLINKETGEKIYNIIKTFDPNSKEENYQIQNINYNNLNRPKIIPADIEELEIKKEDNLNENIIINKQTGERINNIIYKNNIFIDKDNGNCLKNIVKLKDSNPKKEKIIKINIPIDNEGYELPIKFTHLEIRENQNTNEEIIYNRDTGFPINNIIKIKNENKDIFIDKKTGDEFNNIINNYDENGKEIFTKIDIIIPLNKDYIELISEKDNISGNETLVNKNSGERIDNIEIVNNNENRGKSFMDKETGKKILGINIKRNPLNGKESYIYIINKIPSNNIINETNNIEGKKERNVINKKILKNNPSKNDNLNYSSTFSQENKVTSLDKINKLKNKVLISDTNKFDFEPFEKQLLKSRLKIDNSNLDVNDILNSQNSGIFKSNEFPFDSLIKSLKYLNKSSSKNQKRNKNKNLTLSNDKSTNSYHLKRKINKCGSQGNMLNRKIQLNLSNTAQKLKKTIKFFNNNDLYKNSSNITNENNLNISSYSNKNRNLLFNNKLKSNNSIQYNIIDKKKNKKTNEKNKKNQKNNIKKGKDLKENQEIKKKLFPDPYLMNMRATKNLFEYKPIPSASLENHFSPKTNYYTPNGLKNLEQKKLKNKSHRKLYSESDLKNNYVFNGFPKYDTINFYLFHKEKIKDVMLPNAIDSNKFKYFKK